jgi:hypothetical protein
MPNKNLQNLLTEKELSKQFHNKSLESKAQNVFENKEFNK